MRKFPGQQHGKPFARAVAMMIAINNAFLLHSKSMVDLKIALAAIGPYPTGKRRRPHGTTGVLAARRVALKRRNVARNKAAHKGARK